MKIPYDVAECSSGEVNVTISGIGGAICSPPCPDMSCPSDPVLQPDHSAPFRRPVVKSTVH